MTLSLLRQKCSRLKHWVTKAVAIGMAAGASNSTPRAERVITVVQWVKGMREMGCTTYSGEEDAEIAVIG